MRRLEPFNPFDTGERECFPDLQEGLTPLSSAAAVSEEEQEAVDIELLSRTRPADVDTQHPPDLGYLPPETSQRLEAECQAWFDEQSALKAIRVRFRLSLGFWRPTTPRAPPSLSADSEP